MDNQKKIDDVLSMIEGFMSGGGGHMNVEVNSQDESLEKHVVNRWNRKRRTKSW